MSTPQAVYRRIRRRETHSPRSLAAIVVAVALILTFAWLGLEILLSALRQPALLAAPAQMLASVAGITSEPSSWVVAGGAVAAVVGLVLILVAVTAGPRARHVIETTRTVTVADDEVIASGLARRASSAAGVSPDNVRVTLSRRSAEVRLIPMSGIPIDRAAVADAVAEELGCYQLEPALRRPRLIVSPRGKVGG